MELLGEIDEDTVEWTPNYDGTSEQPVVLPARFPNLLVNGSGGIAVGMATNIPPHNLGEVIDATLHLIDNPDATVDDLMQFVKGPDFPTGAQILGRSGILDAYRTGRGSIKLRAVAEIEEDRRGDLRIVVTEVPYQTSVEVIGQKIAELVNDRKIEGIRDVRNESSGSRRHPPRRRAEARRQRAGRAQPALQAHPDADELRRCTCWRWSTACPACSTSSGRSRSTSSTRREVVRRRTEFRLRKAKEREHIVEGLVKALDMIDAIIALIRGSEDADAARAGAAWSRRSSSREIQAQHILDMQLRRLTQLDGQKLRDELAELRATIAGARSRSSTAPTKLDGVIKDELGELRDKYADERKTVLTIDTGDLDALDLIDDEEVVVVLSSTRLHQDGRGRRVPAPGPRWTRRARRQPARRGLRRAPAHHHDALVPAVLHEPRQDVPAARARDPDEGAHRARQRAGQPAPARRTTSASRRSSTPAPTRTASFLFFVHARTAS